MHFRKRDEIRIQDANLDREPKSPIDLAREIMGERNVFSSEDAEHYWGITLSREERQTLLTIPFSKAERSMQGYPYPHRHPPPLYPPDG